MDYAYWAERLREGRRNAANWPETVWEAQGPLGLSFMVRTMAQAPGADKALLAAVFAAHEGALERPVRWLFEEKGEILISRYHAQTTESDIMLAALSLGAEDVEFGEGDVVRVLCRPGKLAEIAELLAFEDIEPSCYRLCYRPKALFALHEEAQIKQVIALMDELTALEIVLDIAADFQLDDIICKKWGYDVY